MIINTNSGTKHSILMHVIIFLVFIYHSTKNLIVISKYINLRLIMLNWEENLLNPSLIDIIISF